MRQIKIAYGEDEGLLKTTKAKRTGCVGCLFGIHLEEEPNRLQRMKVNNPELHYKLLNKLFDGKVKVLLDSFNIKYE